MNIHGKNVIPEQEKGKSNDLNAQFETPSEADARNYYLQSRDRLLNVNEWKKDGGPLNASFQLTDKNGKELERAAKEGDLIRIDVPGPGSVSGKGYDWVNIEAIAEESVETDYDIIAMKVRPCSSPGEEENTAHFFRDTATSSFIIKRNKAIVSAEYHGRNELPNLPADNKLDLVRNAAVALGGMIGISEIQWQSLINDFVKFNS